MPKSLFYKRLIFLFVGGVLALFVVYTGGGFSATGKRVYAAFSDGCTAVSALFLGGCALRFCARKGAFDGLTFAVTRALSPVFKKIKRESYYDYRTKKETARTRTGGGGAWYAGVVFLVLALAFLGFAV